MATHTPPAEDVAFTEAEVVRARQEIYDENTIEWYLGRTGTSRYDREQKTEDYITRRVNLALTALQIEPSSWYEYYSRTTHTWRDEAPYLEEEKDALRRNPMPLGRYLVHRAIEELPIESDEGGDSSVDVELTLADGGVALFHALGDYWRDYIYKTISAGDERKMDELTEDGVEPDDSSVEFIIDTELRLTRPN